MQAENLLLLIEDNLDDAALAMHALERTGTAVQIEVASSVNAGLEILLRPSAPLPRVVFVDLNMPEKNGFDFLRIVRSHELLKTLPVVVLTTSNRPADVDRSYRLGANSFVTKPIDFTEFLEVFSAMSSYWLRVNQIA